MRIALALCALLAVAGCSDDGSSPRPAFEIAGRLADANGEPVAGAAVVLDYDIAEAPPVTADKPRTKIVYEIAPGDTVRMIITPSCGDEILYDTGDRTSPTGIVSITWDGTDAAGKQVPEGVYVARLLADGREATETEMVLARNLETAAGDFGGEAAHIRENWRLDAVTDLKGGFVLERPCWDFGHEFVGRDEAGAVTYGYEITHRVRLWYYPADADFGTPGPWVEIDPESGGVIDFVLPPRP